MIKYLLILILVIALAGGVYYAFSHNLINLSGTSLPNYNNVLPNSQPNKVSSTSAAQDYQNTTPDQDLTSLDADMKQLDNLDTQFNADLNQL